MSNKSMNIYTTLHTWNINKQKNEGEEIQSYQVPNPRFVGKGLDFDSDST